MSLAAKQGLDLGGLSDLSAMLQAPAPAPVGEPMQIDIDLIDEDPANARREGNPGYTEDSIAELAEQIKVAGGIKSPLSVRPHPTKPGRYIINHGHRRRRAARHAGLKKVPCFVDASFSDFDQVVENVHREGLTARELADFIGSKLVAGMTQAEIAKRIGKSRAWVHQYASMLHLPEPVAAAVAAGQVADVTLAKELATAHKENPDAVKQLLAQDAKPTRAAVKAVRGLADGKKAKAAKRAAHQDGNTAGQEASTAPQAEPRHEHETIAKIRAMASRRDQLEAEGVPALRRLLPVAQRDTGQSRVVARFLLNLYNGNRFPFDNTDLRGLDDELLDDCLTVLRMDARAKQEVHTYFEGGSKIWEGLVKTWGFKDYASRSWR